jgi:hypothetical protein
LIKGCLASELLNSVRELLARDQKSGGPSNPPNTSLGPNTNQVFDHSGQVSYRRDT